MSNNKFEYSIKYQYLLKDNSEYSFKKLLKIQNQNFVQLFRIGEMLKEYSKTSTWDQIKNSHQHYHEIPIKHAKKKCEKLLTLSEDNPIVQLKLKNSGKFRIIGFLSKNNFHLMAIDINHAMYNGK